jgi:hypothetical protein
MLLDDLVDKRICFTKENKPVDLVRFVADVPDDDDAIVTRTSRLQQRPPNISGRDHVTAPGTTR